MDKLTEEDILKYATKDEKEYLIKEGFLKNTILTLLLGISLIPSLYSARAYDSNKKVIELHSSNYIPTNIQFIKFTKDDLERNPKLKEWTIKLQNTFPDQSIVRDGSNGSVIVTKPTSDKFNPKDSDFYDSKTGEYDEDDKYDFQQLQKNKLNVWNKLSNDWKKSQMIKKKSQSNKKKTTSGNTNRRVSNTDF